MIEDIFIALKPHARLTQAKSDPIMEHPHLISDEPVLDEWEMQQAAVQFAIDHHLNFEMDLQHLKPTLWHDEDAFGLYQKLIRNFYGILAIHGPTVDLNPVSDDHDIAALSKRRYLQAIDWAKRLHARYLILHSQYNAHYAANNRLKNWLSKTTRFWEEMVEEHLKPAGLIILLENEFLDNPEPLRIVLNRVNSPLLKACLDIGHINLVSEMAITDWLDVLGPQVEYVQAHNNHGEFDEHLGFEKGTIDMPGFLNHLTLLNHRVHLAIELSDPDDLADSFDMVQPFLKTQAEHFASKSFLV